MTAHYDNSPKNENLMHHHHDSSDASHSLGTDKEVHFREANQSWDEMFTPFIQYSIDPQGHTEQTATGQVEGRLQPNVFGIAQVVGCLDRNSSAGWVLTRGSEPVVSQSQATSSSELKAAATEPLGSRSYDLLGVSAFTPSGDKGQKVAVKGILINDSKQSRLNVTSLQVVGSACP